MKVDVKRLSILIIAGIFLIVSFSMLVWGFWPPYRETVSTPLAIPDGLLSLPEARTIRLTYAPVMREGDAQIVELNLSAGEWDGKASEEFDVIAEARLDMDFAGVRPAEAVSTALVNGSEPTFYWELTPRRNGNLRGTLWLYLRFIPKTGGEEARQPVSAQLVEVRSRSMLGRTGSEARVWGVVGAAVGLELLALSALKPRKRTV